MHRLTNLQEKKETAAAECVSDEALVHLKSYKYSSVDKSLISNYILKHYVCWLNNGLGGLEHLLRLHKIVEWMCEAPAVMASTKYGDAARVLRNIDECDMSSDIHARPGRTGTSRVLFKSTE